ncbi:MAG: DUF368 domain-containing protein [Fervidobacterium sp.]|nr:DUF368 domain-containing protein [Fervidobacterium sp.]
MHNISKPIVAGLLMGWANVIPGVSGGTIAVITGIFERLINVINELTNLRFKKNDFLFLLIVGIGIITGLLTGSKVLSWAFENYSFYTYSFFFGLILFSLLNIRKDISKFRAVEFLIGTALVIIPYAVYPGNLQRALDATNINYVFLFLAGVVAGGSMILPGLSGSLMLMILGFYENAIEIVAKLTKFGSFQINDFLFLLILGTGVLVGIGIVSKVLKIWFEKAKESILNFILGLIAGSLYPITPAFHGNGSTLGMFLWIFIGSGIVYLMNTIKE